MVWMAMNTPQRPDSDGPESDQAFDSASWVGVPNPATHQEREAAKAKVHGAIILIVIGIGLIAGVARLILFVLNPILHA